KGTDTVDFKDVERLRNEEFTSGDKDLLHLGIASIGVEYSKVWQKEFAIARERNLPLSAHTMMTHDLAQRCRGVTEYYRHHALGPDLLLIHAIHANAEELKYLAETRT